MSMASRSAVQLVLEPFDAEPDEIWVCEVLVGGVLDDPQALVKRSERFTRSPGAHAVLHD